jgi:mRNA-degrading endonuclease RelE of RelBE toxin-antitoxin system
MAYEVRLSDLAAEHLKGTRVFDRRRIVDEIYLQLEAQPTVSTRNRKRLDTSVPDFEHIPPIWELRVGDYRVFYDVDERQQIVNVRAVRRKVAGQTTEDIIHERGDS